MPSNRRWLTIALRYRNRGSAPWSSEIRKGSRSLSRRAMLIHLAGEDVFYDVTKLHEFVELGRFTKIAVRTEFF